MGPQRAWEDDMTAFRFPERLGAFSLWIAPEIYPLAEAVRYASESHRALLRERVLQTLPGERLDLAQDQEFLDSATGLLRRFEELWEGLEREQSIPWAAEVPRVRRAFLASAVEWAMDLHYEVRKVHRVESGSEGYWQLNGRAWDGERPFDYTLETGRFPLKDKREGERVLLEGLTELFCGAIGGLIGWTQLVPEAALPPKARSRT
jgi:hypothetical protein